MNITENAANELNKVLDNFDQPGAGVHIFSAAGCCGPSIQMEIAKQPGEDEAVLNIQDIDFFVDKNLLPTMEKITIDYSSNGFLLKGFQGSGCCG